MATNWTMKQAYEVIKANEDKMAIADIFRRFPFVAMAIADCKDNVGAETIFTSFPDWITARKVDKMIKDGFEVDESEDEEEEIEEKPVKKTTTKKTAAKKKATKKVEPEEEDEEEEEEEKPKKKKAKKSVTKKSKKPEPEEEEDDDDDDDDWDI